MDQLFKKAMVFSDAHFGRGGNSPIANKDNLDFLDWAIDKAKSWGAETAIFCGDWHDNRHSIHVSTLHSSLLGFEKLNAAFNKTWCILGNHDLFFRDTRDVSSVAYARHLTNIEMLTDQTTIGDVTFLPWLVGDEHKNVRNIRSRYVFSHLELPGAMMNSKVEMPASSHAVQADQFKKQEYVFTGHFHMRQTFGNVIYLGNIMPFDFSDNWDEERGVMLLEFGKEPVFEAWPDQPLFRTMKFSEMIENSDKLLLKNMTVRASVDIPIGFDEAQEIRDALITSYDLRKIELGHPKATDEGEQEFSKNIQYQSVDQIVEEGLAGVESIELSRDRLVEIYKGLVA